MTHLPAPSPRRTLRGFTLVELLVVIGIIALLISMLLPALNKARFSAKVVACGSNHRQIYTAMVMYANDNNGFLPGTRSWNGDTNHGAVYGTYGGDYPWEPQGAGTVMPTRDQPRWFGIGQLMHGKYLPPSRVVTCPDFYTGKTNSFLVNDGFDLESRFDALSRGNYAYIEGSYVMNTIPYYADVPTNRARGKIGKPGRDGGWWNPPGPRVPHIRAYIMCLTGIGRLHTNLDATITHERKGVNVTYIDGHVVYQPITQKTWTQLMWLSGPQGPFLSSGGDNDGTRGFWPWATLME